MGGKNNPKDQQLATKINETVQRCVEVDFAEWKMEFRDYPLHYMDVKDAHYWGTVVAAEHLVGRKATKALGGGTIKIVLHGD